jgi:hypothetical protein
MQTEFSCLSFQENWDQNHEELEIIDLDLPLPPE